MRTPIRLVALCLVITLVCASPLPAAETASRQHPYLFFGKDDIPKLKERVALPLIAPFYRQVLAGAGRGGRGRAAAEPILCAGLAYNLTGEQTYADQGVAALMSAATSTRPWIRPTDEIRYCDLDMGSRALAVAYGYDLLYNAMTDEQRAQCREALSKNVFAPYMEAHALYNPGLKAFTDHEGHWEWWTTCYFNWNAWVNGDIGLAGLAMLDEVPEAPKVVEMARASLKCMAPEWDQGDIEDGGWDEGPMYWGAGLTHAVRFYAALERVLGTDDGYFELPGVKKTMQFAIDFCAPDGKWVNFADCPDRLIIDPPSELYFLASRYNNPQYMRHLDDNSAPNHILPFALLWRPLLATPPADPRRPVRLYRDIDWAVLYAHGLFLPFKAGDLTANHGQNDDNSLLLWVNGQRMLDDPGYGVRDTIDHNCLLVNGHGQFINQVEFPYGTRPRSYGGHSNSYAHILQCGQAGPDLYLVSDAASCYAGLVDRYRRHVVLAEGGYVVVFDEVSAPEPSTFTVNWHMLWPTDTTGVGQALISAQGQELSVVEKADGPSVTTVGPADYDGVISTVSSEKSRDWRCFSVLAPGDAPKVEARFTADRATVTVNEEEHVFERTEDGTYRYAPAGKAASQSSDVLTLVQPAASGAGG